MVDLLTRVDDISTVPEAFREAYTEKDGAHVLNATAVGSFELADTAALKSALGTERDAKEGFQKSLKAYDPYKDIDLKAAVAALGMKDELAAGNVDFKKQLADELKAQSEQLVSQHSEALTAAEGKTTKLMDKLRVLLVDNQAIAAINEAKGNIKNLLPHVQRRVKVVEADGDFGIQVLTEDGKPAIDGEAKPVTLQALIKGFEKDFPFAFKAVDSSGGGGAGKSSAGAPRGGVLTLTQAEARDTVVYQAAKARAAKEGLKLVMED